MCFDGSGIHAPPAPRLRFPDSAERSVPPHLVFIARLGQRGIAPLDARPLNERMCEVQPGERHLLHAEHIEEPRVILPEQRAEDRRRGREAEGSPGLRVHLRHRKREVGEESNNYKKCSRQALRPRVDR